MPSTKRRKKHRTHVVEETENENVPCSFVFKRGTVGPQLSKLVTDMRQVMKPFTASELQEHPSNKMKDFLQIAGPLGVTHFMIVSSGDVHNRLRIAKVPQGPTFYFNILEYSLAEDLRRVQKNPHTTTSDFQHPPLVVLNNFNKEDPSHQLMTTLFQKMFPAVVVDKIQLEHCKRVVLFEYQASTNTISMRQYAVTIRPQLASGAVQDVAKGKTVDMSQYKTAADYVLAQGAAPTPEHSFSKGRNAVGLVELGPRMTLQLTKVEGGFHAGPVLYAVKGAEKDVDATEIKDKKEKKVEKKAKEDAKKDAKKEKKAEKKEMEKEKGRRPRDGKKDKKERKDGDRKSKSRRDDKGKRKAEAPAIFKRARQ